LADVGEHGGAVGCEEGCVGGGSGAGDEHGFQYRKRGAPSFARLPACTDSNVENPSPEARFKELRL
jgi:hypothetical protein